MSPKRLALATFLLLGWLALSPILGQTAIAPPGTTVGGTLALPRPAKPYPAEQGLRVVAKAGQPRIVGIHLHRLSAGGQFRMYMKFASAAKRWVTFATSKDGVNFTPSKKWLLIVTLLHHASRRICRHLLLRFWGN